jgi:cell division cycle 20-like protein 1 (cofactor of APC complex)
MGKSQRKILSFNKNFHNENDVEIHSPDLSSKKCKTTNYSRKINTESVKVLDAPSLQDDFYFNLVDWSESNFITIGLINHVYSLNASTNKSFKLHSYNNGAIVSSICSNNSGDLIAVGNTLGELGVFDFEKYVNIRNIDVHNSRIGS